MSITIYYYVATTATPTMLPTVTPDPGNDHLLPFGPAEGDQVLPQVDDGSSPPQVKMDFPTSCPVFGAQEDTIFVSIVTT